MAQDSMPWDGTTLGHAASTDVWGAPYSSAEWADAHSKIWQSNVAKGYVLPAYGNNLVVTANSPAAMNVLAGTGAITIRGRIYENTAQQTLTVTAADATNPRIDRVVVRITFASQTVELAVLAGTPAATPALPTLTQDATTYEISLFYIWVAAAVASIAETEIHDERVFAPNLEHAPFLSQENLIHNSEFMAFSDIGTNWSANGTLLPPDRWQVVASPSAIVGATKPVQMSRGRYVQITSDAANEGMSQTVRVKASTIYSFKIVLNVTAGDVGVLQITDNGASPATITRNIRRTGSDLEEIIYYTTPSDATTVTISLLCLNSTDIVKFGQTLLVEGYSPGPFRQIHETIFLRFGLFDTTTWFFTAKSDGITTVDLDTAFSGIILPGTRAVWLKAIANDSGSAGADANVWIRETNGISGDGPGIDLHLVTNDSYQGRHVWVPLDINNAFEVQVNATGALTCDVLLVIYGIQI